MFQKLRMTHWEGRLPDVGDNLHTQSGSHYTIVGITPNTRKDAKSVMSLTVMKLTRDEVDSLPENTVSHRFHWNGRKRR